MKKDHVPRDQYQLESSSQVDRFGEVCRGLYRLGFMHSPPKPCHAQTTRSPPLEPHHHQHAPVDGLDRGHRSSENWSGGAQDKVKKGATPTAQHAATSTARGTLHPSAACLEGGAFAACASRAEHRATCRHPQPTEDEGMSTLGMGSPLNKAVGQEPGFTIFVTKSTISHYAWDARPRPHRHRPQTSQTPRRGHSQPQLPLAPPSRGTVPVPLRPIGALVPCKRFLLGKPHSGSCTIPDPDSDPDRLSIDNTDHDTHTESDPDAEPVPSCDRAVSEAVDGPATATDGAMAEALLLAPFLRSW